MRVCVHACVCTCMCTVYKVMAHCEGVCGVCPLYTYRQAVIAKLAKAVNKLGKVQLK